jgi:hypothetical protein
LVSVAGAIGCRSESKPGQKVVPSVSTASTAIAPLEAKPKAGAAANGAEAGAEAKTGGAPAAGPATYVARDFSDIYHAEVRLLTGTKSPTGLVQGEGLITIRDHTKTEIVQVGSPEKPITLVFELHDGAIRSNVHDRPYGEHSLVIFEDLNFDGVKDFAIQDGRDGCYGGPSYRVYLAKGSGFVHSESYSGLTQGTCGFFELDAGRRRLRTMTKSGCCWHQFTEYVVVRNEPRKVQVTTESVDADDALTTTVERLVSGKWVKQTKRAPAGR